MLGSEAVFGCCSRVAAFVWRSLDTHMTTPQLLRGGKDAESQIKVVRRDRQQGDDSGSHGGSFRLAGWLRGFAARVHQIRSSSIEAPDIVAKTRR